MRCTFVPRAASQSSNVGAAAPRSATWTTSRVPSCVGLSIPGSRAVDLELEGLDRGQPAIEAGERVAGDDLAVVHDDDAIAEALCLLHVVRRVEQRLAAPAQLLEVVEDGVSALRIDADRRLVEEQHVGIMDERGRDVQAPLHAAAERARLVPGAIDQADEVQRGVDALVEQRARQAVERTEEAQVRCGAEVLVDREFLRHDADATLGVEAVFAQLDAIGACADEHLAAVGADQSAEHRDRRRLAGTVWAEQADDLARADGDREVGDDGAVAVRFGQASGFEHLGSLRRNKNDSIDRLPAAAWQATDRRQRGAKRRHTARAARRK